MSVKNGFLGICDPCVMCHCACHCIFAHHHSILEQAMRHNTPTQPSGCWQWTLHRVYHRKLAAYHKILEMKVKIKTSTCISQSFKSDIGFKQGFPLSPTLLGVCLGEFVIKLLLYADYIVLISKSAHGLQMHLYALEHFCRAVGMQVNTRKTKIMIFSK